ncbi:acyl-CoA dehydrogenase family protein [Streptomyces varsoviensis]|uniref:acyl-CoA dehydrogenase family protein n=1 Tax=Streptomyces varsoviensis TaxID=67373 RepID=UPI0033E0941B
MEFGWNTEQRARYATTLAGVRVAFPLDRERDERPFTREDWLRLGKLGVLGASLPERFGGGGLGALDTARVIEAVGEGCSSTGLVFAAAAHQFACARPLLDFAEPAVQKRLLPGICSGALIAGNAMTEADAGSDVSRLAVTATPTDGGYVLDGTKSFVSNGPVADVYVTYATTDAKAAHLGLTGFVVDRDAPGVVAGPPFEKTGLLGCPAGTVSFDGCFVPDSQVLGAPGLGSTVFQTSMAWERACLFALYLGVQQRLLDACTDHVRRRRQFQRRLSEFQAVSHRLAEMKLRLESGRLLLYRACWELDREVGGGDGEYGGDDREYGGDVRDDSREDDRDDSRGDDRHDQDEGPEDGALWAALSKLAVSEGVLETAMDAVRLFGARGYLREDGIEAALRDAVPGTLFSGTSDIQREIIARELGL